MSNRTPTTSRLQIARLVLLVCGLVLTAPASFALETTVDERKLGGHTFMPSQVVEQPFMTRSYSMTTGVGFSKLDTGNDKFTFAAFGLEANVQQPIVERFAVDVDLAGVIIAGTDGDAAFQIGADAVWSIGAGVAWNWIKKDKHAVTLTLSMGGGQEYLVSPGAAIQVAVNQAALTTAGLLTRTKNFEMNPGINGAYGLNEYIGVFGSTGYLMEYSNPNRGSSDDSHSFQLGFGGSFDMNPTEIPIGFTFGYLLEQEMNNDSDTYSFLEFGLLYAPNDHFNFGFSLLGNIVDFEGDTTFQSWTGTLGLVYYQ